MKKLRFAVAGLGRIGKIHLENLLDMDNVEVVAVMDPLEEAQAYARKTRSCDSFTAHLMGLLSSIGHIVVFHTLLDVYKSYSGLHPKIEVLNKLTKNHAAKVSAEVVESWGLPDELVETLKDYQLQANVNDLAPLGRALYYGRLCAVLFMLFEKGHYSEARVRFVAHQQGLHAEVFDAMWMVLSSGEESLSEVWG